LILIAICIGLSLLYIPPVDIFYDDTEIFRYFGRLIAAGGVPYRDVFDHKPPLIYFFNVCGPWGIWLINTVLVLGASLLFYRLCRRAALPCPWLLPLLFNLLIRNYLICFGVNMTRGYTAIFLLYFFCILLDGDRRSRFFWLGLLTAATFFMQQDGIIVLLPFGGYALLQIKKGKEFGLTLAGITAVSAPLLLFFAAHHAMAQLWQDAFQFNFRWYLNKPSAAEHFRAIKQSLQNADLQMTFILAIVLGAFALAGRHRKKALLIASLATVLLCFIPEMLSGMLQYGYAFWYYLLPLSATLPILVFVARAYTEVDWLREKKNQLLYGLLLCFMPFYDAGQHATHLSTNNDSWVTSFPEYQYLRQHRPADRQLYAFGNNNWVRAYNEFGIFSPCQWIYQHFWGWYPGWDTDGLQLKQMESDLQRNHTQYIIYDPQAGDFRNPASRTEWESFLNEFYQLQTAPGSKHPILWTRR
jgi:hypothetical protein